MSDEKTKNITRATLPDTPDVSLSAALEYAKYRVPDEVWRVDGRSFYRALNAAARAGKVRFWGFKHEGLAFENEFGPNNIVRREIDPTYFAADDSAAMRGFDSQYDRIEAFCFTESAEYIEKITDEISVSDHEGYESYSNVRVERDGLCRLLDSFCKKNCTDAADSSVSEELSVNAGRSEAQLVMQLQVFLKENPESTRDQAASQLSLSPKSRPFGRMLLLAYVDPNVPRLKVGRRLGSKTKSPHR